MFAGWAKYLKEKSDLWLEFNQFWFNYTKDQDIEILVLFYEDMVSSLDTALDRIVDFLGVQLSSADKKCVLDHGEGLVHRKYLPGESPFTKVDIDKGELSSKVSKVREKIKDCLSSGRCKSSGRETL